MVCPRGRSSVHAVSLPSHGPINKEMALVLHDPSFLFLGKPGFFLFPHPNTSKSRFKDASGTLPRTVLTSRVPTRYRTYFRPPFFVFRPRQCSLWSQGAPLLLYGSSEIPKWLSTALLVTHLSHIVGACTHTDQRVQGKSTLSVYTHKLHT